MIGAIAWFDVAIGLTGARDARNEQQDGVSARRKAPSASGRSSPASRFRERGHDGSQPRLAAHSRGPFIGAAAIATVTAVIALLDQFLLLSLTGSYLFAIVPLAIA